MASKRRRKQLLKQDRDLEQRMGHRREAFKIGTLIHPAREQAGESQVLGQSVTYAGCPEVAEHAPELEGAKPTSELDARVH